MNIISYLEELRYIQKAVPSWKAKRDLLASTIGFHLNNGLGRRGAGREGLDLQIMIDGERCALHVRPNRGDLFILYEVLGREAYAIPRTLLDPNDVRVIVDCGANIGVTALYLAKKYKNARVVCVEPDPDNFEVLVRNVASIERIEVIWAAVVGETKTVHLTCDREAYGNRVQDGNVVGATVEVPGLTVADICNQKGISRIDLMKVDIEGSEADVFADPQFLPTVKMIAIELHAPYGLAAFRDDIAPYGFRAEPPGSDSCRHAHLAFFEGQT